MYTCPITADLDKHVLYIAYWIIRYIVKDKQLYYQIKQFHCILFILTMSFHTANAAWWRYTLMSRQTLVRDTWLAKLCIRKRLLEGWFRPFYTYSGWLKTGLPYKYKLFSVSGKVKIPNIIKSKISSASYPYNYNAFKLIVTYSMLSGEGMFFSFLGKQI